MNNPVLIEDLLHVEYLRWLRQYGYGRNAKDLRFGQFLSNNYELPSGKDPFYEENAGLAFAMILDNFRNQP